MELLVALVMILVAAAVIAAKVILWITKSARRNKQETTR